MGSVNVRWERRKRRRKGQRGGYDCGLIWQSGQSTAWTSAIRSTIRFADLRVTTINRIICAVAMYTIVFAVSACCFVIIQYVDATSVAMVRTTKIWNSVRTFFMFLFLVA